MRAWVCEDCELVFDLDDAAIEVDYLDDMYDRGLVRMEYRVCPHCKSGNIHSFGSKEYGDYAKPEARS